MPAVLPAVCPAVTAAPRLALTLSRRGARVPRVALATGPASQTGDVMVGDILFEVNGQNGALFVAAALRAGTRPAPAACAARGSASLDIRPAPVPKL
jgi:hypothetical protein